MLKQVAEGVLVHESDFLQSQAIVVPGRDGVLLIDPGVRDHEMACLAGDLRELGRAVVAAFSTHPHWDHLLWHAELGTPPRYGTARCAAEVRRELSDPDAKAHITEHLEPTGIADQVSLDRYGQITALPAGTGHVPWDGPRVRIIEHQAHAPGHAALVVEEHGVLVAGDMLSDILIPMPDLAGAADPIEEYLAALHLLEGVAGAVDVVVPGHGSVGRAGQVKERIDQDRAYVLALRDGRRPRDPRIGRSVEPGWEWMNDVHDGQARRLAERNGRDVASAAHAAIAGRDWDMLKPLLHPYLHWARADGQVVRGRTKVIDMLRATGGSGAPASVELRDGQIYRWTV